MVIWLMAVEVVLGEAEKIAETKVCLSPVVLVYALRFCV